jgi:hypothetical protein
MEERDEWQFQHRYLSLETINGPTDDAAIDLHAALTNEPERRAATTAPKSRHFNGRDRHKFGAEEV